MDLPNRKRAIGTKWVFKNKKDERGIVIRNKTRLVAQGHRQEEGIDYKEVFAPMERIEAIRLFLAYASFIGFLVDQMDVKSAFLYGTIEEEVYVTQPPRFKDPDHPDKVYKVVKALYGLHQAPRAWHVKRGRGTKLPQSSGPPVKVGDEAVHKELGDIMERAATTASSFRTEQASRVNTLGSKEDSMKLMELMEHYTKLSELFWGIATARTTDDGEVEISANIDGQVKTITEESLRRHLMLEDSDEAHDSPLPRVYTLRSNEGSLQQNELMDLVTKLTDRIEVLENDMQQTKKVYSFALTKLILRMKKLEKKGRKIFEIDKDPTILFVHPEQDMEYDFDISTAKGFTTASVPVTTASASISTLQEEFDRARQEQEVVAEADQAHDIDWSDPAVLRYHALQNRSFSVAESSKKRSREDYDEDNAKKQKLEDDVEKEEVRDSIDIVPRDDIAIDIESLATKYPIVNWKTHDVLDLHILVQERIAIHMMIEKKYPLIQEMLSRMLSRRLEVDQESKMAFELLWFIRSQLQK
ncbi:putative ribonuclease H-like domain-containing protein [Tanacetum coccineum]